MVNKLFRFLFCSQVAHILYKSPDLYTTDTQCFHVAEIPAKKSKGARGKGWPEEFVAKFWPNFAKSVEKRPKKIF
jgi:hypothetical protein